MGHAEVLSGASRRDPVPLFIQLRVRKDDRGIVKLRYGLIKVSTNGQIEGIINVWRHWKKA